MSEFPLRVKSPALPARADPVEKSTVPLCTKPLEDNNDKSCDNTIRLPPFSLPLPVCMLILPPKLFDAPARTTIDPALFTASPVATYKVPVLEPDLDAKTMSPLFLMVEAVAIFIAPDELESPVVKPTLPLFFPLPPIIAISPSLLLITATSPAVTTAWPTTKEMSLATLCAAPEFTDTEPEFC